MHLDVEKLRQVVLNFIDNAIYYSKPGSTVHIKLKKDKHYVTFIVKDTGIGVPKSEQPQLFGRFFRATNARPTPVGRAFCFSAATRTNLRAGSRAGFAQWFCSSYANFRYQPGIHRFGGKVNGISII